MSLQHIAKHIQSQGRGPDDQLVHMSKNEVSALQKLAQQHGGDLTVNPKTGLPEAGFLSGLLPTIIGAGLAVASDGTSLALTPELIGAGVGAADYAATGSLSKGLMAGIGAYGGAGMVGSLADTGAGLTQQAAGVDAISAAQAQAAAQGLTGDAANQYVQNAVSNAYANADTGSIGNQLSKGASSFINAPSISDLGGWRTVGAAAIPGIAGAMQSSGTAQPSNGSTATITPYTYARNPVYASSSNPNPTQAGATPLVGATYQPGQNTSERTYFNPTYTAQTPYTYTSTMADGGEVAEQIEANSLKPNQAYPGAHNRNTVFTSPTQTPIAQPVINAMAEGGISDAHYNLGGYSDGGRLLKGPGDGVSDSIPATIGHKQPARLADGEFVVPARIVSELGNGSTEAGARKLYAMMDRVQKARGKTVGKDKIAVNTKADKHLPA